MNKSDMGVYDAMLELLRGERMSELKPCPFCGGEAETLTAESMHGGYLFGIMCNDCRSRGDVYDTEAEAIEAWNTRAERTCNVAACYDTADVDSRGSNAEWYFAFTCGDELYWDEPEPPNFCPDCGAHVLRNTSKYSETDAKVVEEMSVRE